MPFHAWLFMQRDSLAILENAIFSIYCTETMIQLRVGCHDCDQARLISAHRSYENALAFGQVLVEETGLPLEDFAGDR
jgi:hypothetical protein